MKKLSIIVTCILLSSLAFAGYSPKVGYKIISKIHLPGDEKWDYLFSDDVAGLLYISHGNMVQVVDQAKGELVGKIEGLNGVHGIAIATTLNKGFISTKNDNSVTVFDTKTYQVIQKLEVTGKSPDAILYDAFSQKVFVFNGHSDNVTVLNAKTNAIVATITLPGNPEFSATENQGRIFVNLENKSSIAVINATTFKIENVWPLAPGEEPTGLALDKESHRLFSVCANKLMVVVDAETGKVITTLPTGENTDGAAFDPSLKCAYSSNGAGTLTVVKEVKKDTYAVFENIPTQKGAKTIAVNRKTHHIYLPTAEFEVAPGVEKPKVLPGTFVVIDIMPEL
jgi:YVTN family beta-propeller protein